jgi:thiol-disulfide isomerase/thioredoxin
MFLLRIILLALVLTSASKAFCQNENARTLNIGDKVPDITFEKVLNYKTKTTKISDFKGKLIILDFWSVNCGSCIAAFPKMDKLQKEFNSKVQIFLVNPHDPKFDSEEKIKSVLTGLQIRTGFFPSLPIPIQDTILNKYFPHQSVPHEVWIDASGRLIAITNEKEVNNENIQAVLDGRIPNLLRKDDWAFLVSKPLLVDGNGGSCGDFLYRSMFTRFIDGIGYSSGFRGAEEGNMPSGFILNRPLSYFVLQAYSDLIGEIDFKRLVLDVSNPVAFNDENNTDNLFCYEVDIPPATLPSYNISKYLKEDLRRVFNISAFKEKRRRTCLVIQDSIVPSMQTRHNKPEKDLRDNSIKKYIHDYTISEAIRFLDHFDEPLINTTISNQKIDIDFPDNFDLTNQQAVIEFLKSIGFEIKEKERELDMVVITDKGS